MRRALFRQGCHQICLSEFCQIVPDWLSPPGSDLRLCLKRLISVPDFGQDGDMSSGGNEPESNDSGNHVPSASAEVVEAVLASTESMGTSEFVPGGRFLRFEICEKIGAGSFGQVWKSRDPLLDRFVAIKVPKQDNPALPRSVIEEARRASGLSHPGIVHVYEVLEQGNCTVLVLELIEGPTLKDLLLKRTLSVADLVGIVRDVAAGLQHAHEKGLVHRDVKPGNILLRPNGSAALTDFGLAIPESSLENLKDVGSGTPKFMSPEQATGNSALLSNRTDIFCLGLVLFFGLTGKLPYPGKNYRKNVAKRPADSLRKVDPKQPMALDQICSRCLARDPEQRYGSAADLLIDLESFLSQEPVAGSMPVRHQVPQRLRVVSGNMGTAVAVVTGILVLCVVLLRLSPRGPSAAASEAPSGVAAGPPGPSSDFGAGGNTVRLPTLHRMPRVFVRPYSADWGQPDYVPDAEMWAVSTATGQVMAECSSLGSQKPHISVELSLRDWIGSAGLFWGLRPHPESVTTDRFLCYVVEFLRHRSADGGALCVSELTLLTMSPGEQRIEERRELWLQDVPVPTEGWMPLVLSADAQSLRVEIGDQQFSISAYLTLPGGSWLASSLAGEAANQAGITGRGAKVAFRNLRCVGVTIQAGVKL